MRRPLYFLLILAMLACLAGCSQKNQNVPDRMLEWEVEDYLKYSHINSFDPYTSYDMQTSHSYDKQTKTDTVRIKLTVNYPKCVASSSYEGTYKYNKENDEWEFLRGDRWSEMQVESFTMSDSQEDWIAAMKNIDFTNLEIPTEEEIEGAKVQILGKYQEELSIDSLTDFWAFGGGNGGSGNNDGIIIYYMAFNDEDSAESVYRAMAKEYSDYNGDYASYSTKGKNYEYMQVKDEWDDRILLVNNENRVFFISFRELEWVPYGFLYEGGFVSDYNADWG